MSEYIIVEPGDIDLSVFLKGFTNPCYVAMLGEGSSSSTVKHFFGKYENTKESLKNLNNIRTKAGIFFTPNGDFAKSRRRVKKNGKNFYYLVMDFDGVPRDDEHEMKFFQALEMVELYYFIPNARYVIRTKNGYHVYYQLESNSKKHTGPNHTQYKKIMDTVGMAIAKTYGNESIYDRSVGDISRMFRLPGYKYWKDNLGVFEPYVVSYTEGDSIDFVELLETIEKDDSFQEENKTTGHAIDSKKDKKRKEYYEEVNSIPILEVVESLGYKVINKTRIVDKETGVVSDGWRVCHSGNYVNNFTAGKSNRAVGEPFSFVYKHFINDKEQTLLFFKEKYGVEYPAPVKEEYNIASETYMDGKDEIQRITDGSTGVSIIINKKKKYILKEDAKRKTQKVANFYINPIAMMLNDDGTQEGTCLVQLVGEKGDTPIIKLPTDMNPQQFSKSIREHGPFVMYDFPKRLLAMLLEYIFDQLSDEKIYINKAIGFNKRNNFIGGDFACIYDSGGNHKLVFGSKSIPIYENEYYNPTVKAKGGTPDHLSHSIDIKGIDEDFFQKTTPEESKEIIKKTLLSLCDIYSEKIMIPLALTSLMGIITPFMRRTSIPVPYGFLFGITQSGKTTISDIIKNKLLRLRVEKLSAGTTTILPLQEAMKSGLPTFIGEYRHGDKYGRNKVSTMLRDLYDGTSTKRGTSDLSTVSYSMVGTMIIDGEHLIDDPATFSRGIFLHCRNELKKNLKGEYNIKQIFFHFINVIFDYIKGFEKTDIDPWHAFRKNIKAFKERIAVDYATMGSGESSRVNESYACLVAVADLFGMEYEESMELMKDSMNDHLNRILGKGAKTSMLWDLAGYIRHASDDDPSFLRCRQSNGEYFVVLETYMIKNYLELNRKIDANKFNVLIESFRGEKNVFVEGGNMVMNVKFFNNDPAILEAITYCIERKRDLGVTSYSQDDSGTKEYIRNMARELSENQIKKFIEGYK
jgi:hypothetical protein